MTHLLYNLLIAPYSQRDDYKRAEIILNFLLLGTMLMALAGFISVSIDAVIYGDAYNGVRPVFIGAFFSIFLAIYALSRFRQSRVAATLFVMLYYIAGTYSIYSWGILNTQGQLIYAVVLIMSGVLLGSRFLLLATGIVVGTILGITHLNVTGIIEPNLYWISKPGGFDDSIVFSITFGIITIVSWLSSREVERSLTRAQESEAALKEERDLLEHKVEERTHELKNLQAEKIMQLYRFAEFGRLASGLFHDLVNPLTAVSLNLEELSAKERSTILKQAVDGTKRMESFIKAARKQIQQQRQLSMFAPAEEIESAVQLLSHKAKTIKVKISLELDTALETYGSAIKFHQLATNLISNAIDCYEGQAEPKERKISVRLEQQESTIIFTVQDWGSGIADAIKEKIYDPFFSSKGADRGLGLGLSISKDIVEQELLGTITVKSSKNKGTLFTVSFPIQEKRESYVE
jgi:signal transduction histidine kinase